MKKLLRLLPVLFLLGCGKNVPPPEAPNIQDVPVQVEATGEYDPIASNDAVTGGSLTMWEGPYPKSLNYFLENSSFAQIVTNLMFEPLVELHSTEDKPIGHLASTWEISPDKKTYTFHLDPAAKWSDGQPVTAEDVQFYYDTIMDPKNLTSLYRVDLSRFSRPEILDPHTVRIAANEVHWKNFWVAAGMMAFPKHAWQGKDFNTINFEFPVVSGPYALDEVKTNRSVSLKRRPDWWGRAKRYNQHKYNFDHLVFKAMEEQVKVMEVFKKGDYDAYPCYYARVWVQQTDFPAVTNHWVVKQKVFNQTPRGFQGLAMNLRHPIFQDVRVRQALALLLDRDLLNQKLMFNEYFLLNSYFPALYPNNVNPDVPVLKYDAGKARALLKDAGWQVGPDGILAKDGQPFSFTILEHDPTMMNHLNIFMQAMKDVGIKCNVEIVSDSTYTKRVDNHEFDAITAAWEDIRLRDPEAMWSSKTADEVSTQNYTGLKDAEVDKLIDEQKTEMDLGKRNEILKQLDTRLVELSPYVLFWEIPCTRLLYWNRFGTPKYVLDKYGQEEVIMEYWWYDPAKAKALDAAMAAGTALPAQPAEVHYQGP